MSKLHEKLLLFIDNHKVLSVFIGLSLLIIIFVLLSPLFLSVPISTQTDYLVISQPLSVIPGKAYTVTIRAKDNKTSFDVTNENPYTTITKIEDLDGNTYRRRITFEVSSPYPRDFKIHSAGFTVTALSENNTVLDNNSINITIDTISITIRLLLSLVLSAPFLQIIARISGYGT